MLSHNVHTPSYASRGDLIDEVVKELRLQRDALNAAEDSGAEQLGMHSTDVRCLSLLARAHEATAGEIARALGLTTGSVTPLLDRLERSGLVARSRDAQDRRRVNIELTSEGRQRAEGIWPLLDRALRRLIDGYSGSELILIRDFLRRTRTTVAEQSGLDGDAAQSTAPS